MSDAPAAETPTLPAPLDPPPEPVCTLLVGADHVVTAAVRSNVPQAAPEGSTAVEVGEPIYLDARSRIGRVTWDGAALQPYAPPPPPPVVPEVISDRQCFQQAAILGRITQDEALAAVTVGALPKAVSDGIAALPADQQFGARMLLCGATEFHRSHPMTPAFLGMIGLGVADRDPFWTAAAAL